MKHFKVTFGGISPDTDQTFKDESFIQTERDLTREWTDEICNEISDAISEELGLSSMVKILNVEEIFFIDM